VWGSSQWVVDQGLTGHKVKQHSTGQAATCIAMSCSLISLDGYTVALVRASAAPGACSSTDRPWACHDVTGVTNARLDQHAILPGSQQSQQSSQY
jgi:hypothetical protein